MNCTSSFLLRGIIKIELERNGDMGKYSSKKVDDPKWGIFDSTTEWKYWNELLKQQEKGEINNLDRQKPFLLVPAFKDSHYENKGIRKMEYISDMSFIRDGQLVVVDVKGSLYNITNESKCKIKMFKYLNQDTRFELIVTYDSRWFNLEDKIEKKQYTELVKQKKSEKKARKEVRDKLKAEKDKNVSKKKDKIKQLRKDLI